MELHQVEQKIGKSDSVVDVLIHQMQTFAKEKTALHNTEDNFYTQLLEIGRKALQKYVDSLEENSLVDLAQNKQKEALPYKKTTRREYLSIFGPITIKRAYYWKNGCENVTSKKDLAIT